jgi:hypothetical protein
MNPLIEFLSSAEPIDVKEEDDVVKLASVVGKLPEDVLMALIKVASEEPPAPKEPVEQVKEASVEPTPEPEPTDPKLDMLIKRAEAGDVYAQAYVQHLEKYAGIGFIGRGVGQIGKLLGLVRSGGVKAVGQRLAQQARGQGLRKALMGKVKELKAANPNLSTSAAMQQAKASLGMYGKGVAGAAGIAGKVAPSYAGLFRHYAPALGVAGGAAAVPAGLGYLAGGRNRRG